MMAGMRSVTAALFLPMWLPMWLPMCALLVAAGGDPLQVALTNTVPAGQKPSLKIVAQQGITKITASFEREDDGAARR